MGIMEETLGTKTDWTEYTIETENYRTKFECGICEPNAKENGHESEIQAESEIQTEHQSVCFCHNCYVSMCELCATTHSHLVVTKSHKVNWWPKGTLKFKSCDHHSKHFYEFVCLTHTDLLCIACLLQNHKNCEVEDLYFGDRVQVQADPVPSSPIGQIEKTDDHEHEIQSDLVSSSADHEEKPNNHINEINPDLVSTYPISQFIPAIDQSEQKAQNIQKSDVKMSRTRIRWKHPIARSTSIPNVETLRPVSEYNNDPFSICSFLDLDLFPDELDPVTSDTIQNIIALIHSASIMMKSKELAGKDDIMVAVSSAAVTLSSVKHFSDMRVDDLNRFLKKTERNLRKMLQTVEISNRQNSNFQMNFDFFELIFVIFAFLFVMLIYSLFASFELDFNP